MEWYEKLFSNYAHTYDTEVYTQGTLKEVDFLEDELNHDKTKTIFDLGCGTGRHSVELAKRGYKVKGIDLSENMLQRAREKADEAGVKVDFQKGDARYFTTDEKYDLVIMLCEAGFCLMETDAMNFDILKNAVGAVKKGGKLIFTCLNALFPLHHNVAEEMGLEGESNFDVVTFRMNSTYSMKDDDGNPIIFNSSERFYAPSEITLMLDFLGMKNAGIYGEPTGQYSRSRPLTKDSFEMLVVAEKP